MKYDRHYRSAMEKITATDQWKADTLAKMADARRSRFRLSPKRAAAGLAACLAVAAVLGSGVLQTPGLSTKNTTAQDASGAAALPEQACLRSDAAAVPRAALASAGPLFDAADVTVCSPQPQFKAAADSLPVYSDADGAPGEWVGDFALVDESEARASLDRPLSNEAGELVYVCSAGYCQPAWQFRLSDGGLCWAPAAEGVLPA